MFDSSSSGSYRRLNRGGNGFTRNVTFFGILVGLVIVFSVFYLYTSASNDATALRFELNSQSDYVTKLKNELLELNVKLEELKTSESTCKESKGTLEKQADECSTNLKQEKENVQTADTEKSKINSELESLKTKNAELSSALEAQKVNMTAMQTVGVGQEAIVIKLNETIDAMKRDLILKDEIIKKLESGQIKELPLGQNKTVENKDAAAVPPNLQPPSITTTKSAVIAPQPAAAVDDDHPDVLAMPQKAQPGDRVKIEEANQKKQVDDGALLQAAQEQDADVAGIDPPAGNLKSGEI